MHKTILILIVILLIHGMLYCLNSENTTEQNRRNLDFEKHVGADPDGVDMFRSSISYTQVEKDKRFNADFKLYMNDFLTLNLGFQTGEISDGKGEVGFLNLWNSEQAPIASGGKVTVGFTLTNYFTKLKTALDTGSPQKILDEYLKKKKIQDHFKKKEQLAKIPMAMQTFEKKYLNELRVAFCHVKKYLESYSPKKLCDFKEFRAKEKDTPDVKNSQKTGTADGKQAKNKQTASPAIQQVNDKTCKAGKNRIPIAWKQPDFGAFQGITSVLKVKTKLEEIKKKVEADLASVTLSDPDRQKRERHWEILYESLREIKMQLHTSYQTALEKTVIEYDLMKKLNSSDIPPEEYKKIASKIDNLIKGVWTGTLNMTTNYTAITYLDAENAFTEKKQSKLGLGFQIKVGRYLSPNFMYGISFDYSYSFNAPKTTTIIQQYLIDDVPVTPDTLISKDVLLSGLEGQNVYKLRIELRGYILDFFALNPFIHYVYNADDEEEDNITLAVNALFSLDKKREFVIGVQPIVQWKKGGDDLKYDFGKPNIGIALYLTKTFRLNNPYFQ